MASYPYDPRTDSQQVKVRDMHTCIDCGRQIVPGDNAVVYGRYASWRWACPECDSWRGIKRRAEAGDSECQAAMTRRNASLPPWRLARLEANK
jgi:predicted RNA-binding Zn-ribbon protein involved in translation (DUF1610 family)